MLMQLAVLAGALFVGLVGIALVFLIGLRARAAWALDANVWLQRNILNPRRMRTAGTRGAAQSVIRYRGRISGRPYAIPVGAAATDDGFVIALLNGSRAQWPKNVLASGSATIDYEGHTYQVERPEVIPMKAVAALFPASNQRLHRWTGVDQCLRLRRVEPGGAQERSTDSTRGERDMGS